MEYIYRYDTREYMQSGLSNYDRFVLDIPYSNTQNMSV